MTFSGADRNDPIVFSPNLRAGDPLANHWMRQATLRLRREVAWLWHERGGARPHQPDELPPVGDRTAESLDLARHWAEKRQFFETDPTASFLTDQLRVPPPETGQVERASFGWAVRELDLDPVSAFSLALGLSSVFDPSGAPVIATCLKDAASVQPTLTLVQRLWDFPEDALVLADPMHPLFSRGLLRRSSIRPGQGGGTVWDQPLTVPSLVARALLAAGNVVPSGLHPISDQRTGELTDSARMIGYRLRSEPDSALRIVPLLGPRRAAHRQTAIDVARVAGTDLWEYRGDAALLANEDYLATLMTVSWLTGRGLFIGHQLFNASEPRRARLDTMPLASMPVTLFVAVGDRRDVAHLDAGVLLPFVEVPRPSYEARLEAWREGFGDAAAGYEPLLKEIARRFRYDRETILTVARELRALPAPATEDDFVSACRAELHLDIGELATHVEPRFADQKLILAHKQSMQFEEQVAAMQALTTVHYDWGTARVWNEGGLTLLFAGPPGTGKTMAAEILAHRLKLPMYRIDLSQVVNKYVGETEKNLKRLFDAADTSDMVLFFDEADALFGKRIEASDARDRYANLEISYLLERMERFKGLAILGTNRKGDLDQAFLRRIRYVIDFQIPEEAQRAEIWRQSIPAAVAAQSQIDVPFLARQFPLSGGHIRSIVFNACLQSAHAQPHKKELRMKDVLIAVKREYDKINRSLSADQLGPYAADVARLE